MNFIIRNFNLNISKLQIQTQIRVMSNKKNKSTKEITNATGASAVSQQENAIFINKNGDYCLNISAKPGAKETIISDIKSESIDVKIAAPPVDGEANKELIRYIAKLLKLKTSDVNLDKGGKSRNKMLILSNCQHMSIQQLTDIMKKESES